MVYNYSFYINTLKKSLFLVSFVLIILIVINKSDKQYAEIKKNEVFGSENYEQVIIEPKFIGIDKDNKPFTITALTAKKVESDNALYLLEKPSGQINDNEGESLYLNSLEGKFDQKNQKIYLSNNVILKNLEGLYFKTESAKIDLETNNISGEKKTLGEDDRGTISSSGFEVIEEGNRIIFNGPARLVIAK